MKKLDYILIVLVTLIGLGIYALYFNANKINASDTLYIEVLYKNEVVYSFVFDEDISEEVIISRDGIYNEVYITYEHVHMHEANCPDQYCMHMYMNYKHFTPIICTNGVVVRIVGVSSNVDGIV